MVGNKKIEQKRVRSSVEYTKNGTEQMALEAGRPWFTHAACVTGHTGWVAMSKDTAAGMVIIRNNFMEEDNKNILFH